MTVTIPGPKLFQPIRVGTTNLQHRVVMAPMARFRADVQYVPGPLAVEYYKQRTSVPGTLVITEATTIAPRAGGYARMPGIWNDEQIAAWKPVRRISISRLLPSPPLL
jgi:NADPH2 dehydrogenase